MLHPYPGFCGRAVHNLQKFRVPERMSFRSHQSSVYGYGCCAEIVDVTGTVMKSRTCQRCSGQVYESCSGTRGDAAQAYINHRSFSCGNECPA